MSLDFNLTDLSNGNETTFLNFKSTKIVVIDFWHTKCKNCPGALSKLDKLAKSTANVQFIACALSQGDGNEDLVKEMIDEWENLTHVFVTFEVKEQLKLTLQFSQVPFIVIIDQVSSL